LVQLVCAAGPIAAGSVHDVDCGCPWNGMPKIT
jgi:hypothetical protein